MRNLLIRTASGIVYVALMVAAVFTPWVAIPLAMFFIIAGLYEFYKLCKDPTLRQNFSFWYISALCLVESFYALFISFPSLPPISWIAGLCIAYVSLFVPELIAKSEFSMSRVGLGFLGQMWIVVPVCVLFLIWIQQSPISVLAFFILIWMSDTAAYIVGSLFGKHKLAPNISPGKTREGFLGSCIITMGLAIGLSYIPMFRMLGMPVSWWIVYALIIQVFGLMGDLVESLFKRKAGVKDSGNIIPGHGGVLDRIDSILIATIPAYLFYYCALV